MLTRPCSVKLSTRCGTLCDGLIKRRIFFFEVSLTLSAVCLRQSAESVCCLFFGHPLPQYFLGRMHKRGAAPLALLSLIVWNSLPMCDLAQEPLRLCIRRRLYIHRKWAPRWAWRAYIQRSWLFSWPGTDPQHQPSSLDLCPSMSRNLFRPASKARVGVFQTKVMSSVPISYAWSACSLVPASRLLSVVT